MIELPKKYVVIVTLNYFNSFLVLFFGSLSFRCDLGSFMYSSCTPVSQINFLDEDQFLPIYASIAMPIYT